MKIELVPDLQDLNDGRGVGSDVAVCDHGSFRLS